MKNVLKGAPFSRIWGQLFFDEINIRKDPHHRNNRTMVPIKWFSIAFIQ
jgi:hypothetical protein